jgi:hypothetical protein
MRLGETLPLTATFPNDQRIEIPETVVRCSRGQEIAIKTVKIEAHTQAGLKH